MKPIRASRRGRVARSTLADANDTHDWRIYADFARVLIVSRGLFALPNLWECLSIKASTRWTRRRSTYA